MGTLTPMAMKGQQDIFQIITIITAVTINIEQPVQIVQQELPIPTIVLIVQVVEVVVSIVQVLLLEAPVLQEATILSILLFVDEPAEILYFK